MYKVSVRRGIVWKRLPQRTAPGICLDVIVLGTRDPRTGSRQPEVVGKQADSLVQQDFRFSEVPQFDHDLGGTQPRARRIREPRQCFGPKPKRLIVFPANRNAVRQNIAFR